jgi:pimeloyl-ACP methyl ester carboxylesterase/DNA-binding CsgD family transcriptional regulator
MICYGPPLHAALRYALRRGKLEQHIRFCTTSEGVRLAYATSGQGPPLIKVVNWLTHAELDWDSPVWRHWLAELSSDHTLVRYDGRGCGLSDWEAPDYSFPAWVRDLETVVDSLGMERFALLGISRGAPVAIAYAVKHPERVSGLVLYGGFARGRLRRAITQAEAEHAEMLLKLIRLGWGQDSPAFRQVYATLFIPHGRPEQISWLNNLQRLSTSPEIAARLTATSFSIDVSQLAARVAAPTLVFHVQKDAVVSFEEGRQLARLIPGARFVPLPGENHILLADEPAWPRFLTNVRSFLDEIATTMGTSGASFPTLTPREREVLDLVAQGFGNAEIAARLVMSPKTVRNHITNIFDKLGVNTRAQAIVLARESGLGR